MVASSAATGAQEPRERVESRLVAEAYFTAWAETYGVATVLIRHDLFVLWSNGAALRLYRDGKDVALVGGRLTFPDKATQEAVRSFLWDMQSGVDILTLARPANGYFVVRVDRLDPPGHEPGFALSMYETGATDRYFWADIGRVFALTPTEALVVKRLAEGERAEVIASNLEVALHTVRTHIRRIYAKLEVGSREELFAAILPFRIG